MPLFEFPHESRALPCFVRLRALRPDGFIEFDFAIGDPGLAVDLIMPRAAYEEFCAVNRARFLTAEQGERVDAEQAKWRFGQPGAIE